MDELPAGATAVLAAGLATFAGGGSDFDFKIVEGAFGLLGTLAADFAGRAFATLLAAALTATLGLDFAATTFFWTGAGVLGLAAGLAGVAVTLPNLTAFLVAVFTNGFDFSLECITALTAGLASDFVALADALDLTCALVLAVAAGFADFLGLALGLTFAEVALACFGLMLDLCTVLVFLAVVFIDCLLAEIATLGSKLPHNPKFFSLTPVVGDLTELRLARDCID